MTEKLIPTVIALMTLVSTPAVAQEIVFTWNGANQFNEDDSFDVISANDETPAVQVGLAYELYQNIRVGLEYEHTGEDDELFDGIDVSWGTNALLVSAEYAYPLTRWFRPHVRVGLGPIWGNLEMRTEDQTYEDGAVGFGAYAVAGYDLVWELGDPDDPKARFKDHLALGLSNDYGWVHRTSMDLDELGPRNNDPGDPTLNMGDIALSGWTWRLGFSLRYRL